MGPDVGRACARQRGKRGARAKGTDADSLAPLGSEREREKGAGQTGANKRGPPVRSGRRTAGPGGLVWAEFAFSFFLNFLIAFPFLFSRVFQFKFKSSFKFKLIQTCATIQKIFKLSMMQHVMTQSVLTKINN
jgi:hypothetical protein